MQGLPLLADWEVPHPAHLWWEAQALKESALILADLPMGMRNPPTSISRRFRLPMEQRVVLRRSVREAYRRIAAFW